MPFYERLGLQRGNAMICRDYAPLSLKGRQQAPRQNFEQVDVLI
jgi:hypothetical protein